MNKLVRLISLSFLAVCLYNNTALAFDIPDCISDPQDVSGNIDAILKCYYADSSSSQSAQETTRIRNDTMVEFAARLYGEALAARAQIVGTDPFPGGSGAEKALQQAKGLANAAMGMLGSKDKPTILQNNIKKPLKELAVKIKKTMELEAQISNLQAAQVLFDSGYVLSTDEGEE